MCARATKSDQTVLIVDDDPDVHVVLGEILSGHFAVTGAVDAASALRAVETEEPHAVLLDLNLGEGPDGFHVLDKIRALDPDLPVVILSCRHDIDSVVRAMQAGASHYIPKPPRHDELLARLRIAMSERKRSLELEAHRLPSRCDIVGSSPAMEKVREGAHTAATCDLPVLILGETGTGKGLVGQCIHSWGRRHRSPYLDINVAALSQTLIDSELFGHEKGAFTGANERRRGIFELASGGTVLLDEIGDLPRESQIKLLKVVEEGRFWRVGSDKHIPTEARVVAATHQDLESMTKSGAFREDLYYRLAVLVIQIPPLRDRSEDIPLLARTLLGTNREISDAALDMLMQCSWPGNVRQLKNTLDCARQFSGGDVIDVEHLRMPLNSTPGSNTARHDTDLFLLQYKHALDRVMDEFRRDYLRKLLARCGGNKTKAAQQCGLSRAHLHELIGKLGLSPPRGDREG